MRVAPPAGETQGDGGAEVAAGAKRQAGQTLSLR